MLAGSERGTILFCSADGWCFRACTRVGTKDKMKKLSGIPLSAFVTYSKKRKNTENPIKTKKIKKIKKKRICLSDILPANTSTASIDIASADNPPPVKESRKKYKSNVSRRSAEATLLDRNSGAAKGSKKLGKAKTCPQKQSVVHSPDTGCTKPLRTERHESLETSRVEESRVHSKTRNKSPVKDESSIISPKTGKSSESRPERSTDTKETIRKSWNNDPAEDGKSLFQWLIHPLSIENFFKNNWESAPLHIKRSKSNYYKLLMSTPMLDKILRDFHIVYTKNIDITSFSNGRRETHNPSGRARPSVVWDYYSNGCSVRMLNPQTFIPKLHALNATLQEFFGCFVGANSYLTPPDSQGFAPHYDDIEAFIIQIEGKKRWRLYKPTSEREYLPRYSSINLDSSEIGEPVLDTVLNAGDLLYFPRGTIHQGETIDGTHSLHITLSVYQKNSWCDYLEKLIPEALKSAIATDSRFREGLPLDYLKHVGFVNSSEQTQVRQNFIDKTKDLLHRLIDNIDVDKVADQMAKGNIHDFLPPVLSPQEQECSAIEDGERMTVAGTIETRVEIEPDTRIRLLRSHCVRLLEEEDCVRIYYSTENSKEYHEYEPQFLEVEKDFAPAVKEIIKCYPDFVRVDDLPIEGEDNKVQVARDLWEKCIIVTDVPLPVVE